MTNHVVLLAEEPLLAADAEQITGLHADDPPVYTVLVPADTDRNLLVDVIDHLSLGELREALHDLRGRRSDDQAEAQEVLDATLAALRACGVEADGTLTEGDPMPALESAATELKAIEVVILTRPHAVEDTFHTDWASKARDRLGVPVLHVYGGTNLLG